MTATIFDLTHLHDAIEAALLENGGELTPDLEAALSNWGEDFDRKVEDYALVICEQKALAEAIHAEIEKLRARQEARLNLARRLTERLQQNMEAVGKDRVRGVLKTVALQNNPPSVTEVVPTTQEDLADIRVSLNGGDFVTMKPVTFAWDKRAILDAHKDGTLPEDVARRVTVTQSRSIRIR